MTEQPIEPELTRPTTAPPLYEQDGRGYNAIVHEHYFVGSNDWLLTEFDPDQDLAFGWACLGGDRQNAELGYVSMAELSAIRVPLSARITSPVTGEDRDVTLGVVAVERDEHWPEGLTLTEAIARIDQDGGR